MRLATFERMKDQDDIIHLYDKAFEPWYSAGEVQQVVRGMAMELDEVVGDREAILVCVLKGAMMLTADLMRYMERDLSLGFVRASSYQGMKSSSQVDVLDMGLEVAGRHVILVEDIVDTGRTIEVLREHFTSQGCDTITVASLLYKPDAMITDVPPDVIGLTIPTDFVVGYGMDYDELGRGLDSIYRHVATDKY